MPGKKSNLIGLYNLQHNGGLEGLLTSRHNKKEDQYLEALPVSEKRKATKCFQEVFQLSFEKLDKHLSGLPAYNYYKSVRIFDPRQLPALDHDIQVYGNFLKQLSNPSQELLEEWLIYTQYTNEGVSSLADLEKCWDSMSSRFPLPARITTESIWMPVTSLDVQRTYIAFPTTNTSPNSQVP